jgi:hypothetical protein
MKSWRTTLIGWLTAAAVFAYKLLTHQPITGEDIIIATGAVGLGHASKDSNVTGGSVKQ